MSVLQKSCLGCALVVGILAALIAAVVWVAWIGARGAQESTETMIPELPAAPAGGSAELGPQVVELGAVPADAGRLPAVGLVQLEFRHGELNVRPAAPGERLHVEATYDREADTLTEELTVDDSGRWRYHISFTSHTVGLVGYLRQAFSGVTPRLDVYLPAEMPLDLQVDAAQGGGELELGGLWLRTADIEARQGAFEIAVSEPLREPMESLRIGASMGGFQATGLGNASPGVLEMKTRMGGAEVDLRGAWRADAVVRISASMGGASVRLPRDVNLKGAPGHDREGLDGPTLHLELSASQGEIELTD